MVANSEDISPVVAIHAGAGFVPREALYLEYIQDVYIGLNASLDAAYDILKDGGSSLDAVQAAVVVLEECPRFNAGRGSVMTEDGMYNSPCISIQRLTLTLALLSAILLF